MVSGPPHTRGSTRYVLVDLVRNPRRTLTTLGGVLLGVGLFCGVLFLVDGLSVSMTQRALAPLAIDMQRVVTQRSAANLLLEQRLDSADLGPGDQAEVSLTLTHRGPSAAHEVAVRSVPAEGLAYVPGSALLDGAAIPDPRGSPFSRGLAQAGYNLGTVEPGSVHHLSYRVLATRAGAVNDRTISTTFSSRESVRPVPANQPAAIDLAALAAHLDSLPGVASAAPLSLAALGDDALHGHGRTASGPARIFGFDEAYAQRDATIVITRGRPTVDGALVSEEAARSLGLGIGDTMTVDLPDGTTLSLRVDGMTDLSAARTLFSSRRGGDLETFLYTAHSVVVPSEVFAGSVLPAYERAVAEGPSRLKSPPLQEVDIHVRRDLLAADPATALRQTQRLAASVATVAEHQDYLLDNTSNTLTVAAQDAAAAKRLFVFLGVPGAILAAILAGYAGNVLADAQRREQATLRVRGASRRHLLQMLVLRTVLLTLSGAALGLLLGYLAAVAVLGQAILASVSLTALAVSALAGTAGGLLATGTALYVTGRRSINRDINEDRARLDTRRPLWLRARLDLLGLALCVAGTAWALATEAFSGAPGSVYFGRGVDLNLWLLALPVAVWVTGCLAGARLVTMLLHRARPASSSRFGALGPALVRRSVGRRPAAPGNAALVVSLIVAMATSLTAFTASYDIAKTRDARYANGADLRLTLGPTADLPDDATDVARFETPSVAAASPVVYGPSNTVVRSDRTSDPLNVAALDIASYTRVAPVDVATADLLRRRVTGQDAIALSRDTAEFLQVEQGDVVHALLARATPAQVEVPLTVAGTYERLPGFPDGADGVIDLAVHTRAVPATRPDVVLLSTPDDRDATVNAAVAQLRAGPAPSDQVHLETRLSVLDRDQSSLAALNLGGLVRLDSGFALAMTSAAAAIFVFGLLLQRRREYVTLRAQGMPAGQVRRLISAEAGVVAAAGLAVGVLVGIAMGYYFVAVLRPLFVLDPGYTVPARAVALPAALVVVATVIAALVGARLVGALRPTELLRDE